MRSIGKRAAPKKIEDCPGPADYVNVDGFKKTSLNFKLQSKPKIVL